MTDQSLKSKEPISQGTHSAISLQASGVGPSPLSWQGGLQLDLFGQAPVPAPHSATQEGRVGPTTPDTSGLSSDASSRSLSHALQLSLENRLSQRLQGRGSPEYALTLKHWDMESGVPIFAVRASGHRTSGNDSTGWPTPVAQPAEGTPEAFLERKRKSVEKTGWGTPTAQDAKHATLSPSEIERDPNVLRNQVHLSGWPTPNAADSWTPNHTTENTMRRGDPNGTLRSTSGSLAKDAVMKVGWVTPSSRDWKDSPGQALQGTNPDGSKRNRIDQLPRQAQMSPLGTEPSGSSASTTGKGGLNPEFVRWLMGFPDGWSSYAPTAMRSSRKSGRSS